MALILASIFSWMALVVAVISSQLAHTAASIFPWTAFIWGPQLFMARFIMGLQFNAHLLLVSTYGGLESFLTSQQTFHCVVHFNNSNSNHTSDTSCLVLVTI
jgi:hypothetical protein